MSSASLLTRPRRVAGASSYYRGAQLPYGVTSNGLSLTTPFSGTPYNTTTLNVGHARYNAATEIVITQTGDAGRTEFLAALATMAADGDCDYRIICPAGTLPHGYTLPAKADPTKHCYLVAASVHADSFSTPVGAKIPTNQTGFSTIEGLASGVPSVIDLADSAQARGYSLHGLMVQPSGNNAITLGVIAWRRATPQTTIADYPGEVFIDRCWIKGGTTGSVRRGVLANGPYFKIHDSRITDIHVDGQEAAGIGCWTSGRYHEHKRLTIEAGAQSILAGGADPDNPQSGLLDPTDWFTEEVYSYKPLSWLPGHPDYDGTSLWDVKTAKEAKNMRRWCISNSRTRNVWRDAQNGFAMLFQGLSDNNTNHEQTRIEDIIVRNHHFDYCLQGINVLSRVVYGGGTMPTNMGRRVVLDNILQTRVGGDRSEPTAYLKNGETSAFGVAYQLLSDLQDVVVDRGMADGERWMNLESSQGNNWTITNQIARGGTYGIFRTGGPSGGNAALAAAATNVTFDGNVMYDYSQGAGNYASYAPGCDANETEASMAFAAAAAFDYHLTTEHLTKGVAGGRPGPDIDTIMAACAAVV